MSPTRRMAPCNHVSHSYIYLFCYSCTLPWRSSFAWSLLPNSNNERWCHLSHWLQRRDVIIAQVARTAWTRITHSRCSTPCMASFLAVEEKALAGWTSTSISDFCRSHAPPTLTLLTRISQIGCDSPALAVEAKFCYSLTMNVELFRRPLFFPLSISCGVLRSLMCAAILESTLVYWNWRAVKMRSHPRSPRNTSW